MVMLSWCLNSGKKISNESMNKKNGIAKYHKEIKQSNVVRRRKWHPTPVFLPGKSHGQRSLVGYSPWGHKESDMTE